MCAGHLGLRPLDPREGNAASLEVRREKAAKRGMTFQDHLAAELEKEAENYVQTMRKAASGGDWRALESWATRVLGRPVERVETADGESTFDVKNLTREQRAELRRRLVAEHPELLELRPLAERAEGST